MLVTAVAALAQPGDRVVLGPSEDGGYYLIGLKQAHRRLFTGIKWSTEKVLSQTIERAAEIDLPVELLPAWYDVDDAGGLKRLCDELFSSNGQGKGSTQLTGYHAPYTRDYLSQLIEVEGRERVWPVEAVTARTETSS